MSTVESRTSSSLTSKDLIDFEEEVARDFEAGLIHAPVHLAGGNEDQLIQIFNGIDLDNDWVCGGWRMHFHCLLKGVPREKLRQSILDGRSIALCFSDWKVISSAIVGGICPIAMGIAWSLKREGKPGNVWCFVGDMTANSGIFMETMRYSMGHDLPIHFVLEDNGMSVCTSTREVWGTMMVPKFGGYRYELKRPHVGINKFVRF